MVKIQIVTQNGDPLQASSYWKWKDTNQFLPDGTTPNPNFNTYVDATLAKVILEYTKVKYEGTNPSVSNVVWGVIPFLDFAEFQVVVEEGDTMYEEQDYPNYIAHTTIRFKCYTKNASLGETFFQLENLLNEVDAVWQNYDAHRINGLAKMLKLTKLTQQDSPLTESVTQTESSNYVKTLEYEALYQVARTNSVANVTFSYAQPNTAGDYATN